MAPNSPPVEAVVVVVVVVVVLAPNESGAAVVVVDAVLPNENPLDAVQVGSKLVMALFQRYLEF